MIDYRQLDATSETGRQVKHRLYSYFLQSLYCYSGKQTQVYFCRDHFHVRPLCQGQNNQAQVEKCRIVFLCAQNVLAQKDILVALARRNAIAIGQNSQFHILKDNQLSLHGRYADLDEIIIYTATVADFREEACACCLYNTIIVYEHDKTLCKQTKNQCEQDDELFSQDNKLCALEEKYSLLGTLGAQQEKKLCQTLKGLRQTFRYLPSKPQFHFLENSGISQTALPL